MGKIGNRQNILVEVLLMREDKKEVKKSKKMCRMDTTDLEGRGNLCCCYTIEEDGSYAAPCDIPPDECC